MWNNEVCVNTMPRGKDTCNCFIEAIISARQSTKKKQKTMWSAVKNVTQVEGIQDSCLSSQEWT